MRALFRDILIGVTSFYRDANVFKALQFRLEEYFKTKTDRSVRIWVPGCSTGEEAYSIAIIISEVLGMELKNYKVQIFASDIDEAAISLARAGIYSESSFVELPKKIRQKYFMTRDDLFEVIKPLKELVIFSRHDITQDPPFLRLDLISCRNLLIYFTSELQKKIFPYFHYALKPKGILLLGKSESVGVFQTYFRPLEQKWKLYESIYLGKKGPPPVVPINLNVRKRDPSDITSLRMDKKIPSMGELIQEEVEKKIYPYSVIINDQMNLVYNIGKNPYLQRPDGEATDNIYRNIHPGLSIELRTGLNAVQKDKLDLYKSRFQKINIYDDITRLVRLVLIPIKRPNLTPLTLVYIQEEEMDEIRLIPDIANDVQNDLSNEFQLELTRTKEHLQTVIEELEASNEEMQSMNEEFQSSNEELQSSNEELETNQRRASIDQ